MTHDTATSPGLIGPVQHRPSGPPLVVVMGVSGCGKSTVGASLAARLGVRFRDGDDLHPASNIAAMSAGVPLTDDDRAPWLDAVGRWLREHREVGGVIACSALKRAYRERLRSALGPRAADLRFAHLVGDAALIGRRQAARAGHFMPAGMVASQLATLEALSPDEHGIVLDVAQPVATIVGSAYAGLAGALPTPTATVVVTPAT